LAGEESVAGIGVGLDIDISGWTAGIEKAKAQLDGLTKGAQGATIAVPLGGRQSAQGGRGRSEAPPLAVSAHLGVSRGAVSALRVQTNQHLRTMAQGGQAVQVPVTLGRVPYAQMRHQISTGIGEVPVRIRLDPVGVQGIRSVLTAVLTQTAAGARSPAALAAATDMRLPHRQAGGPVAANRPVVVGEHGSEVYWPRSAGMIIPHAGTGIKTVASRMTRGELDFVGNIRKAADQLSPHHLEGGNRWYGDAGAYARQLAAKYEMELRKAQAILAALSAGTSWKSNKTKFENILSDAHQGKPFRYSLGLDAHKKAEGLLNNRLTPEQAFKTSPKVGQFDKGIGGDLSALVLDLHATRTTTRGALDQPPKSMRPRMEAAWKKVAKERGMTNAQFQAALWLYEQEKGLHSPGQATMGLARGGFAHRARGGWGSVAPMGEDWLNNLDLNKNYNKPDWDEALDPKFLTRFRGDPNDKGPGSGHVYTEPMDPWMYHVTRASNMESILEQGVQPQRGGYNSSRSMNERAKQTYWSRYPDASWGGREPVTLAAKLSAIKARRIDQIGELASGKGVLPEDLHFLGADKRIHPLKHAKAGLFAQADAETFAAAIGAARASERHGRKIGETVYQYPTDEYRAMKTYLTKDRTSGYAIKPDGDLVSLFNAGGRGRGQSALRSAIQRGGSKLDAFDENGFLPGLYSKFGFRETGRDPWNPDYAPPEWRGGTPDVVYMQRLGRKMREHRAAGGRVGGCSFRGCDRKSGHGGPHVTGYSAFTMDREEMYSRGQASYEQQKRARYDWENGGRFGWEESDFRPEPRSHVADPRGQIDKLKAMATQVTQSPNEAQIARRMLHERGVEGYQRGGHVQRKNPRLKGFALYSMRWPTHAQNEYYIRMHEEAEAAKYQPDWQGDHSQPWGSSMGEPSLWRGGTPEHRWAGGVAAIAKARLPKGFRFAFTKVPGTVGTPFSPDQDNPEYQKPPRTGAMLSYKNQRGGRSRPVDDFAVNVINERGKVVAVAPWGFMQEWGGPDASWLTAATDRQSHSRAYLHPHMTKVLESMQGKGLATAMYMASEAFSGVSTKPSGNQLAGGAGLWAQPNRPFGKRYGDIPAVGGHPAYYDSKFDLERTKKTNKKRAALGLPESDTRFLETMVERSEREVRAIHVSNAARALAGNASRPIHDRMELLAQMRERQIAEEAAAMLRQAQSDVGGRLSSSAYSSHSGAVPEFGTQFGMRARRMSAAYWRGHHSVDVHNSERMGWGGEQQALGFADGGSSTKGLYIVNEIGREKYVPKHLEGLIPPDVARQIPGGEGLAQRLAMRRYSESAMSASGRGSGIMEIPGPEQLWAAPGDGWIIPNKFIGRIPHADRGRGVVTQDGGVFGSPEPGPKKRKRPQFPGQMDFDFPSAGDRTDITGGPTLALGRPARVRPAPVTEQMPTDVAPAPRPVPVDPHEALIKTALASINRARALASADADRVHQYHVNEEVEARRVASGERSADRTAMRGLTRGGNLSGIIMSLTGGKQRQEAYNEYQVQSRKYQALFVDGVDPIKAHTKAMVGNQQELQTARKALAGLDASVSHNSTTFKKLNQAQIEWKERVDESALSLGEAKQTKERAETALAASKGGVLQQFGAIQLAGISYQIGMQVAGFLASSASSVMKPFIDTITGFEATSTKVTSALAQELPQNGGQLGVTFGKAAATAGIGGTAMGFLQSVLGPSVQAKGAAVAQGQASDLFRAAAGVNNGAPTGLTGGYGGLFGSSLFAQQLGGGKGYEEQIAGDVSAIGGRTAGGMGAPRPASGGSGEFGPRTAVQGYVPAPSGPYNPQGGYSTAIGASGISNLDVVKQEIGSVTDAASRYAAATGSATKAELKFFDSGDAGLKERAQAIAVAQQAGDSFAEQNAKAGIGWFVNGVVAQSPKDLMSAIAQAAGGTNIPSQAAIVASLQPQLKAQVAQTAASTAFATGNGAASGPGSAGLIGGAFGLQLAANPFTAAAQGGAGSGVALNFQSKLAPQLKAVADLQATLSTQAAQGITDMTAVVSQNMGPQAAAQFTGYVQDVAKYGTEITAITSTLANKQAAVGALQYGNSLRIINRSIKDAQGLVSGQGPTSGAGANLGAVQRLQFTLQQQSEQLSIAQSQRQINFSVASAGFQAPGQTGEQRAANIAEAKYEASIAQKQLNIQKQQVPLAKTAFDVGAVRSLVDLQAQKAINAQEYALSQEQVVAQKRVNALQMAMALSQQRAQKILDGAVGNWNSALSLAAQAAGQYGYELGSILGDIRKGIDQALGISPTTGGGSSNVSSKSKGSKGAGANAAGVIGMTTGATSLTLGEAGTEHVAILRNPRSFSMGAPSGGGGSVTVQVNVSGNTVRSQEDIETLVRRTAAEVERVLQTRGAMLGLRSLGG
jgi:hypothetical protein